MNHLKDIYTKEKIAKSFQRFKKTKITLPEYLLITFLPILSIITFFITNNGELKLSLNNINPWAIYTKIFVHDTAEHLLANLIFYTITILITSIIFYSINKREKLKELLLWIFITTPLITSFFQYIAYTYPNKTFDLVPPQSIYGLSGVISALFALSTVSLLYFFKTKHKLELKTGINYILIYLLFSFIVTNISALLIENIFPLMMIMGILTTTLFMIIIFNIGTDNYFEKITKHIYKIKDPVILSIIFISIILFLITPLFLFPENIVVGENIIDIIGHTTGYVAGLLISYIILNK